MSEREFEELVARLRRELVRTATRRCGRDLGEDAVQAMLARAWERPDWRGADAPTVTRWLRRRVVQYAAAQLRGIARFRDHQRNFLVLVSNGHKRANAAPYHKDQEGEGCERDG